MPTYIVVLLLTLAGNRLRTQQPDRLVGSWRLISMTRADSSGVRTPYWNDHPLGFLVYTADGHVSAQLYDSRRPPLGMRWETAGAEAARVAYVGSITYYGTYSVDSVAGTVTHMVEGAMTPDWIGRTLVRGVRFLGPNRIELRVLTTGEGARITDGTILVWERV